MLFALLFNSRDELIAATPALYQYPVGQSFWTEIYAASVKVDEDCQTAYVEIDDPQLVEKLNTLETDDANLAECQMLVERLISESMTTTKRPKAA